MKITLQNRKLLTYVFASELKGAYVHLDGRQISKYLYMFSSGVELIKKDGTSHKYAPIGPFLGWMIDLVEGKPAPSMSLDPFVSIRFTGENLDQLLKESQINNVAWDAAAELARRLLKQNGIVPKLLIPYLTGEEIHRPRTNRGRHPMENKHRDTCIIMLLSEALRAGYGLVTRNDEPALGKNDSLCDVMDEALKSIQLPQKSATINLHKSYAAIKSIWLRRKHLEQYLPVFHFSIENENGRPVCYVGYANPDLANTETPIESQKCWMLYKIKFKPSLVFAIHQIQKISSVKYPIKRSLKTRITKKNTDQLKTKLP